VTGRFVPTRQSQRHALYKAARTNQSSQKRDEARLPFDDLNETANDAVCFAICDRPAAAAPKGSFRQFFQRLSEGQVVRRKI